MSCCPTEAATDSQSRDTSEVEVSAQLCLGCAGQSRLVSRKTVLLMLKPHLLDEALSGTYSFCPARDCPIVYFEENGGRVFTSADLRVLVGAKASTDPIPLCYCFGFNESHLREEIAQTGGTAVPDRISSLIREGLCACEARNPAGVCCLGEVNRSAKRLRHEALSE